MVARRADVRCAGAEPDAPDVEVLHAPDAEVRQRRAAAALLARGCTRGDRVAFALGSSADLICAVLGAARVGLIPVLLNATLTPAERDDLADDAAAGGPHLRRRRAGRADGRRRAPRVELAPYPLTRPMHYTSGTTGRPKGVTTGLWDDATARAVYEDEAAVWHFDPSDLHLVCSPMYHTVSIRFSTNTLLAGGSLVILSRFDAETALDTLRRHRPTTAFLVPTHLQRILQHPGLAPRRGVRLVAAAGPRRRAVPRVGQAGDDGAGPSRRGLGVLRLDRGAVHGLPARRLARAPGHGRAGPPRAPPRHRARRRRPERGSSTRAAGRAPSGATNRDFARFAYWRDPEATAQAWRGSACTVGDLGRLDADGFLYLTGRRHDLIISGGVNVYPAEVENVLSAVPGVREVAVFGLPDEQWGQRVCAAYVADARRRRGGPAGRRLGPPGPVQAAEVLHRRRGPAAHRHGQADAAGGPAAPRSGGGPGG